MLKFWSGKIGSDSQGGGCREGIAQLITMSNILLFTQTHTCTRFPIPTKYSDIIFQNIFHKTFFQLKLMCYFFIKY